MKNILIRALTVLLLFIITVVGMFFAFVIGEGAWDLPKGLGLILAFLLLSGLTAISLLKFKNQIGLYGVLIPIILGVLLIILPKAYFSTFKFSVKVAPFYISIFLGVLSGYLYDKKEVRKLTLPLIFSLFPLLMSFGAYDLWIHRIEYGNWTGEINEQKVEPFELIAKNGDLVTNETLADKIVLFDFWFIGCGPCWVKFPELQRIYEKYESDPAVEIYAVNRPMPRDKPGALFQRIEDKGYTFPVLRGTQEVMDLLGVYKYPSVMILNQQGEMVFVGELEDAEIKLESMLSEQH
ncbi:MAG: TlpA family protein disulfide reductase [Flavobacteriaceae bacterium]|nr:MAG: TlpA family protein disulfide reductase [Flavobacteriaceae bacterium]